MHVEKIDEAYDLKPLPPLPATAKQIQASPLPPRPTTANDNEAPPLTATEATPKIERPLYVTSLAPRYRYSPLFYSFFILKLLAGL